MRFQSKASELPEEIDRRMILKAMQIPCTNTYDDFKEKFMKLTTKYFKDLRTKHNSLITRVLALSQTKSGKPAKALTPEETTVMERLKTELTEITAILCEKLRIDCSYELTYIPLSSLNSIWTFFSDIATKWELHSSTHALFFTHVLSSTWDQLRHLAYNLLEKYPFSVFSFEMWQHFASRALSKLSCPRATEAEGAALFLKLLYSTHIENAGFDLEWEKSGEKFLKTMLVCKKDETDVTKKQFVWMRNMLNRIKTKRAFLSESLFKRASSEDLMHGELRFINLAITSMKFEQSSIKTPEWKTLILELMSELQEISDYCEGLLSSVGIIDGETGNIVVDCRGRLSQMNPVVKEEITKAAKLVNPDQYYGTDYENLLSTGIWLIAKESGNLYKVLLEWLIFPSPGTTNWLTADDVKNISLNVLNKIMAYKHRGAFLKLVDALQVIVTKCTRSNFAELQSLPEFLLKKIFEQICEGTLESNKTLRRSAGIPHCILAILRSEVYPVLLGVAIKWMLERAKIGTTHELRVHSLNILKAIFEDSEIRQDIQEYVYDVLMLATEGLSDPDWKIRNSSLMAFTASTKRIFGSCSTLEEFLNRQGKTVFEFFGHSEILYQFMSKKLKEGSTKNDANSKFAIFPIFFYFLVLLQFQM